MKSRCSRNTRYAAPSAASLYRGAAVALVALAVVLAGRAHAAEAPLIFGVFPNLTTRQTLKTYTPLAQFLQHYLGREVVVHTARDVPTFIARTREGVYDLVLTAPHLAWLARQDAGYRPLLKYSAPMRGLLVTRKAHGLTSVEALRGRTVAISHTLALATLTVEQELAKRGIAEGRDFVAQSSGSHANAIAQLLAGRVDAAIVGIHPLRMQPEALRTQLHTLVETPAVASLSYLAHPRLRDRDVARLRAALLAFAESAEGHALLATGGYEGLVAADDSGIDQFREYALRVQRLLEDR